MMTLKEGLCDGQANGGQSALSSSPPAATAHDPVDFILIFTLYIEGKI
jgi:hypothetical protein